VLGVAPKVFIYTECKLSRAYQSSYFHLGWLEGWHEAFLGWLLPLHATPVEPPLQLVIIIINQIARVSANSVR